VRGALLFDLDDTLVVEAAAATQAFAATAAEAAGHAPVDAAALAIGARTHARALWNATPVHDHCLRVGISSSEGLWCRFEGEPWLREWAPAYRRETWRRALADQGVEDTELATELGERFPVERRARHAVFTDVGAALVRLRGVWRLGLLTNGASCLQREKLAASGLAGHFDAVVVSGDLGSGKPDPAIFRHTLALLGHTIGPAVMVGDSLDRDIHGALEAGLDAVWLARPGIHADPLPPAPVPRITTLADLGPALERAA
jgi:putative hydrolase of the HAD superfamily